MITLKAKHLVIEGRVQGVGFRYNTRRRARQLGLAGWVRNNSDGTVEVFCQGPAEKLDPFLDWLKKGPPGARVTNIRQKEARGNPAQRDFNVKF